MALPQTIPLLGWSWDDLIFVVLAGVMLGGALMVVIGRNIIRSGLYMILSFAALAGFYVLLGAPIVAAAQVLIYIGAISVLILFAIMLTQSKAGPSNLVFHHQAWAAGVAAVGLAVLLLIVILFTDWPAEVADGVAAGTAAIARLLFSDYVLAFEIVSVLLLAAVIGGVFLAKREEALDPGERQVDEPTLARQPPPDRPRGVAASEGP
ncbi:MAG: NADH-quinone oxidoreductase subunit J [Chloroflexi bacterium]|nr:NADH-quinone oxidoreductase subunit J [Chloroflexota bacterium]